MSARRIVATGAAGIAVLAGLAVVATRILGDRAPAERRAEAAAEPLPIPVPAPVTPPVVPATAPAPEPAETAPLHTVTPAAVPRPKGATGAPPWESVDTALRPAGLGVELAAPVSDALADARDRMEPCFDAEAKRLAHEPAAPPRSGVYGPAVLVVRLEALDGRLVVAGTEIASEGTSSARLVQCCRRMLDGYEFAAPVAPPRRYKVHLPLQ